MRAVLLPLLLLPPTLASATQVQSLLTGELVWKKSGNPYVLTGDVTVGWGCKLTLEPGVQVLASAQDALSTGEDPQRVELIVDGTLVVKGPVEFTSDGGEGSWYGIRVRGGRGTVIDGALLTRATQGLSLGMSAVVRNSTVSATARDCIRKTWGLSTLENNDVSRCGPASPARASPPPVSEPPPVRVPMPTPVPSEPAPRRAPISTTPSPPPVSVPSVKPAPPPRVVVTPDTPAPTPRAPSGTGVVKDTPPEGCSPTPQVGEPAACPGYRRWKRNQALGEVPPGAMLPRAQVLGEPVRFGSRGPEPRPGGT